MNPQHQPRSASFILLAVAAILALALPTPASAKPAKSSTPAPKIEHGYMPEMHRTYAEEVRPSRRLARAADDSITKAASKAAGVDLDFCIRLRRNMRREVSKDGDYLPNPGFNSMERVESSIASQANIVGLHEFRLYESQNKSDREGTSIDYSITGLPLYLGIGQAAEGEPHYGSSMLFTFYLGEVGRVIVLDQRELAPLWWACYVLDLTGDGRIDIAISSGPGTGSEADINLFTLRPNGSFGTFQAELDGILVNGAIDTIHGLDESQPQPAISVVDLNNDGVWELEVRNALSYNSGYGFNVVYVFDESRQAWIRDTDRRTRLFPQQRPFYEAFALALQKFEAQKSADLVLDRDGEKRYYMKFDNALYPIDDPRLRSKSVVQLLQSWDMYHGN